MFKKIVVSFGMLAIGASQVSATPSSLIITSEGIFFSCKDATDYRDGPMSKMHDLHTSGVENQALKGFISSSIRHRTALRDKAIADMKAYDKRQTEDILRRFAYEVAVEVIGQAASKYLKVGGAALSKANKKALNTLVVHSGTQAAKLAGYATGLSKSDARSVLDDTLMQSMDLVFSLLVVNPKVQLAYKVLKVGKVCYDYGNEYFGKHLSEMAKRQQGVDELAKNIEALFKRRDLHLTRLKSINQAKNKIDAECNSQPYERYVCAIYE